MEHPALQLVKEVRHAYVKFRQGDFTLAVDPYGVREAMSDADIIIVTHQHGDHYSPGDIEKLAKDDTLFFTTKQVAPLLRERFPQYREQVAVINEGERFIATGADGLSFTAVRAQNKNHPPENTFGVLLALGGYTYYLSGDTDVLDRHVACDVLFCCCDGVYNMPDYLSLVPAQVAAMETPPGLVVPYHFDNATQPGNGERLAGKLRELGYESTVL